VTPDSRNQGPGRSSPEVRFPCRAGPRPGCPCFGVAVAAHAAGPRSASSGSPLLGFLLPRTHDDGCPLSPGRSLTGPLGWVRVARPPPVPSSGFLPLSTVLAALAARTHPLRSMSFAVAPRRFAALFHAARVPGVALQSFPFPRSRTRSRGPVLPCGFAFDRPTARHARALRDQFPHRANPFAAACPKARRTHGPGPWFLVVARRCQVRTPEGTSTAPSVSNAPGSPDGSRHARFEALLSPRVRSRSIRTLAGVGSRGRCSPGLWSPLEFAPAARGCGVLHECPSFGTSPDSVRP